MTSVAGREGGDYLSDIDPANVKSVRIQLKDGSYRDIDAGGRTGGGKGCTSKKANPTQENSPRPCGAHPSQRKDDTTVGTHEKHGKGCAAHGRDHGADTGKGYGHGKNGGKESADGWFGKLVDLIKSLPKGMRDKIDKALDGKDTKERSGSAEAPQSKCGCANAPAARGKANTGTNNDDSSATGAEKRESKSEKATSDAVSTAAPKTAGGGSDVPLAGPASGTSPGGTYEIKPGDTLSKIASEHGTTVDAIVAANPSITDPNKIQAGQTLKLGTASGSLASPGGTPASGADGTYVVAPGDSLSKIASEHGTTVDAIVAANPSITDPNKIQAGQTLKLGTASGNPASPGGTPAPAADGTYVVAPGDSLSKIASEHGTTVDAIVAANPSITDPNKIQAGQSIKLPGATTGSPAAPPGGSAPPAASSSPAPAAPSGGSATPPPTGFGGALEPVPNIEGSSYMEFSNEPDPPGKKLTKEEGYARAVKVAHALMKDLGYSKEDAAAAAGNLVHESDYMNCHVNEYGWMYPEGDPRNYGPPHEKTSNGLPNVYGFGWAQWTAERRTGYLEFCKKAGLNPGSPRGNYAFLMHEQRTSERGTPAAMKAAPTMKEKVEVFCGKYERAAQAHMDKRLAHAEYIYTLL